MNEETSPCPRHFVDKANHHKTIYCSRWTCQRCAPRKLRRLVATTAHTALQNAPLFLLTLRASRLPVVWNRFTQRIRRPYIGAIEHKPDLHIHTIVQKPPRNAQKIWHELGGSYYHITPVLEYSEALKYITKSLCEPTTEARLIRSRDWRLTSLDKAIAEVMDDLPAPPADKMQESSAPGVPRAEVFPTAGGASSSVETICTIIHSLPAGSLIQITLIKDEQ